MPVSEDKRTSRERDRARIAKLEATVAKLSGTLSTIVQAVYGGKLEPARNMKGRITAAQGVAPERRGPDFVRMLTRVTPYQSLGVVEAPVAAAAAPRPGAGGLAGAQRRGESARLAWVIDGDIVPSKELAQAWGLTPQALGPAEKRGELFSIVLKRQRYYPREFLELTREDVAAVCKQLVPLDPVEKLFFWKRPHGALGGRTALQALSMSTDGQGLRMVVQLAEATSAQARAAAAA
jgi:hypothetical protein